MKCSNWLGSPVRIVLNSGIKNRKPSPRPGLSGGGGVPWKECSVMDERLGFVARLLDGEAMNEVCRAFGISRETGYKICDRYKEHGLDARPIARAGRFATPTSCRGRSQ